MLAMLCLWTARLHKLSGIMVNSFFTSYLYLVSTRFLFPHPQNGFCRLLLICTFFDLDAFLFPICVKLCEEARPSSTKLHLFPMWDEWSPHQKLPHQWGESTTGLVCVCVCVCVRVRVCEESQIV